jgi:hypothetical protein
VVLDMWMRLDTCIRCGTREGELYGSLWLLECRPAPHVLVSRIQLLRECMQARLGVLDYLIYCRTAHIVCVRCWPAARHSYSTWVCALAA